MLFCVRRSDGYFFPAPNSQFVGTSETENTLDRCRYVCGTEDIDVYKLDDMALETEEMVAVEGGASYGDLPSAFSSIAKARISKNATSIAIIGR